MNVRECLTWAGFFAWVVIVVASLMMLIECIPVFLHAVKAAF